MKRGLFRKKICGLLTAGVLIAAMSLTACGSPGGEEAAAPAEETGTAEAAEEAGEAEGAEAEEAAAEEPEKACELEDGVYTANFETDSTMFHLNEADEGRGVLTVKDGQMTIHIHLPSKNIVNLYYGLKEDAKKEGAELIEPTTDLITYSDGMTGEVYGFDVPVPAIDEEFDVAIIGTHGNWYDHKVKVTDPQKQ